MSDEPISEGVLTDAFAHIRTLYVGGHPDVMKVRDAMKLAVDVLSRVSDDAIAATDDPEAAERLEQAMTMVRAAVVGTLSAIRAPDPPDPPRARGARAAGRSRQPSKSTLLRIFAGQPRERERPPDPPAPQAPPNGHLPALLSQIEGALLTADRLLASSEPPAAERVQASWPEDKDLLDLMHELLSAHHERDGEHAMREIARLKDDLRLRYGIEAVAFDEENGHCFQYVENVDSADPRVTTVRPALVAPDGLLRKGEVRGPARTARVAGNAAAQGHETTDQERPDDD